MEELLTTEPGPPKGAKPVNGIAKTIAPPAGAKKKEDTVSEPDSNDGSTQAGLDVSQEPGPKGAKPLGKSIESRYPGISSEDKEVILKNENVSGWTGEGLSNDWWNKFGGGEVKRESGEIGGSPQGKSQPSEKPTESKEQELFNRYSADLEKGLLDLYSKKYKTEEDDFIKSIGGFKEPNLTNKDEVDSYNKKVNQLKEFQQKRGKEIDDEFKNHYETSTKSALERFNKNAIKKAERATEKSPASPFVEELKNAPRPISINPEKDARKIVSQFQTEITGKPESQGLVQDAYLAASNVPGAINKAFVSGMAATPKTVAMLAQKLDQLTGMPAKGIEEYATYQLGEYVENKAKELGLTVLQNPDYAGFMTSTLPQAVGSMLSMMLLGGRGATTNPFAAQSIAKQAATTLTSKTAMVGAMQASVPEFEAAKAAGKTDEEAFNVFLQNIPGGLTESVQMANMFGRLNRMTNNGLMNAIKLSTANGLEEASQEAIQQYLTNKVAQGSYDPERDLKEGMGEGAGAGFIVGFVMPGVMAAMDKMSPEQKAQTKAVLQKMLEQGYYVRTPESFRKTIKSPSQIVSEARTSVKSADDTQGAENAAEKILATTQSPNATEGQQLTTQTDGQERNGQGRQEGLLTQETGGWKAGDIIPANYPQPERVIKSIDEDMGSMVKVTFKDGAKGAIQKKKPTPIIEEKPVEAKQSTPAQAIDKYENDEKFTIDDLVDELESSDDPKIQEAVSKYRADVREGLEVWGGREDSEAREIGFVNEVKKITGETPNSPITDTEVADWAKKNGYNISDKEDFDTATKMATQRPNYGMGNMIFGKEEKVEERKDAHSHTYEKSGKTLKWNLGIYENGNGGKRYLLYEEKYPDQIDAGAIVDKDGKVAHIRTQDDFRSIGLAQALLREIQKDYGKITPSEPISKQGAKAIYRFEKSNTPAPTSESKTNIQQPTSDITTVGDNYVKRDNKWYVKDAEGIERPLISENPNKTAEEQNTELAQLKELKSQLETETPVKVDLSPTGKSRIAEMEAFSPEGRVRKWLFGGGQLLWNSKSQGEGKPTLKGLKDETGYSNKERQDIKQYVHDTNGISVEQAAEQLAAQYQDRSPQEYRNAIIEVFSSDPKKWYEQQVRDEDPDYVMQEEQRFQEAGQLNEQIKQLETQEEGIKETNQQLYENERRVNYGSPAAEGQAAGGQMASQGSGGQTQVQPRESIRKNGDANKSKQALEELKSKNLTHVPGLGMGQNQAKGTYVSTEDQNRYETEDKKPVKVKVNVQKPFVSEDNVFYDIQREIIQSRFGKNAIEDLTEAEADLLAEMVTEHFTTEGFDSIYMPQSETQEGELIVFDRSKVTIMDDARIEYENAVHASTQTTLQLEFVPDAEFLKTDKPIELREKQKKVRKDLARLNQLIKCR